MTITEFALAFLLSANGAYTHLGFDLNVQMAPSSHVISLAADPQQRIEAIKAYRTQTGAGLKEAMAVVDKIAASAKEAGA
jgi:ribosomal protein L7/L12